MRSPPSPTHVSQSAGASSVTGTRQMPDGGDSTPVAACDSPGSVGEFFGDIAAVGSDAREHGLVQPGVHLFAESLISSFGVGESPTIATESLSFPPSAPPRLLATSSSQLVHLLLLLGRALLGGPIPVLEGLGLRHVLAASPDSRRFPLGVAVGTRTGPADGPPRRLGSRQESNRAGVLWLPSPEAGVFASHVTSSPLEKWGGLRRDWCTAPSRSTRDPDIAAARMSARCRSRFGVAGHNTNVVR